MAERHGMDYVEVSAKSSLNVEVMFQGLLTKIIVETENMAPVKEDYTTNVVSTARNTSERECCSIC